MVDVRGDVLRPPHGTTPAALKSNIKSERRSFKSNENKTSIVVIRSVAYPNSYRQQTNKHVIIASAIIPQRPAIKCRGNLKTKSVEKISRTATEDSP